MPRLLPLLLAVPLALPAARRAAPVEAPLPSAAPAYAEYLRAAQLEEGGRFAEALAVVDALLREQPREAAYHHLRARLVQRLPGRRGAPAEAEAALREAVALAPDEPAYRVALGELLYNSLPDTVARRREAAVHLERAAQLDAGDGQSRGLLFALYRELGEPARALPWGRAAVKLAPGNPVLRAALAQTLEQTGARDESAAEWVLVLRRGWGATAAAASEALRRLLRRGDLSAPAELAVHRALAEDDPDDLPMAIAYLQALLKAGRGGDALGVALALHARARADERVERLLLAVAWQTGRLDLALEEAEARFKRAPLDAERADTVLRLRAARGDRAGVIALAGEPVFLARPRTPAQARLHAAALAGAGKRAEALALLGRHGGDWRARLDWVALHHRVHRRAPRADELEKLGVASEPATALLALLGGATDGETLSRALPAAPPRETVDPAPANPWLDDDAIALLATLRGIDARAAAALAAALAERRPDEPGYRLQEAEALDAAGDGVGAIARYEALRAARPEDPGIANNLAYLLALRAPGRIAEAVALAGEAVAREPENASYLDTLAWAQHVQGRDELAGPLLEQALRNGGRVATILTHLAAVRAAAGDRAGARALLREALAQSEEPAETREARAALAKLGPARPVIRPAGKPAPRPATPPKKK